MMNYGVNPVGAIGADKLKELWEKLQTLQKNDLPSGNNIDSSEFRDYESPPSASQLVDDQIAAAKTMRGTSELPDANFNVQPVDANPKLPGSKMLATASRYSSGQSKPSPMVNVQPGSSSLQASVPDYEALLAKANELRGNQQLFSNLGKSASQIGAAIAGATKPQDYSVFDTLTKQADQYGQDVKTLQDTRRNKVKEQMEALDLADDLKMSDPNSDISRSLREGAKLLGLNVPDNTTGRDLRNSGINLGSILAAKEAAKSRALQYAQMNELRKEKQDLKSKEALKDRDEKFVTALNKVDQKYIDTTKELDAAMALADAAVDSPTAAVNLARGLVKAIEGAGARVSDKDIQTTLRAGGVGDEMIAWLERKGSGTIPPFQQEDVINLITQMEGIHKNKFEELKNTMFSRHGSLTERNSDSLKDLYEPSLKNKGSIKSPETGLVQMVSPDGRKLAVPAEKVKEMESHGAKRL